MKEERIRKVFLEDLPKKEGRGKSKGKKVINWYKTIGYKVKGIYDYLEFEIEISSYDSQNQSLTIKNEDSELFKIKTVNFENCKLGKLLGLYTGEFKIEIGQVFKDDKRDLTIIDREYKKDKNGINRKYYKYKCNKCGFECRKNYNSKNGEYKEEYWINEDGLFRGTGCSCCCNSPQVVVQGINDIPTTDPWMVKFFQGGYEEAKLYNKSSGKKIKPICPDCGQIKDKEISINNIYTKKSIGCKYCSDGISYPNKFMFNLLKQLNINFISEYSPEWIGLNRYDFYIPSNNLIIEMDGGLGHGKGVHPLSKKTTYETKEDDKYKDVMALNRNTNIIRINADVSELEYIKNNILKSKLNGLYNFDNINWIKIEECSLKSLIKETCELKKDNPNYGTKDIAEIMSISIGTVRHYLKKGSEIWDWINYDSKEEMDKTYKENGKRNRDRCSKQVEVFKDDILLGMFESATEVQRKSIELFGVRFTQSKISNVCLGKLKRYKGFTFKYV